VSDDQNRVEARRWVGQAEDDLRFACVGVRERFYAQACFLSQQAGEKALEALRYLRRGEAGARSLARGADRQPCG